MSDDFPSLYTPPAGAVGTAPPAPAASSSTSAAQVLEAMHEQAEASANSNQAPARAARGNNIDLASESAFPSLGSGAAKPAASGWGAAARTRAAAPAPVVSSGSLFTETMTLPTSSINVSPVPGSGYGGRTTVIAHDATTLGEVIKQLMKKYVNVRIDSSSSTAKGITTFLFKATRQQDIERVKQELRARIVRKVTETVQVPSSTRAFIIGAKGRTLKSITEEFGVNIQIPRDDAATAQPANDDDEVDYVDDKAEKEKEDPLIAITIFGDGASVQQAKKRILGIVDERTSRLSQKFTTIATDLYHLLSHKVNKGEVIDTQAEDVTINIPPVWRFRAGARGASANADDDSAEQNKPRDTAITISGHRDLVQKAANALIAAADELTRTTTSINMTVSKRLHRFLLPPASDEILEKTGCAIEIPPASNPSDQVGIRGPATAVVQALQAVMDKANAAAVDVVDLATVHGINTPANYPKQVARFLLSKAKLRKVADEEGVQIFIPRTNDQHTTLDIVATQGPRGPQAAVASARTKVLDVLKGLAPNVFSTVEVDQLLHRFLIGRKGAKIQSFEEKNKVQVVFPPSQSGEVEDKEILLVYVGPDANSASSVLSEVKSEIQKLAKDAADISTVTLSIPAKLHRSIIGPNGTTLNAIIGTGDERIVNVRFGSSPAATGGKANGDAAKNEDEVVIRGPSEEVKKVAKDIERIAEEAKNDEIVNSYVQEFDIDQRFVAHIVGKGGAGAQKLREELGVRVDFGDAAVAAAAGDEKVKKSSSKKPAAQSHVRIQGRKENVEEAKKRILKQADQLADETTLSIPLASGVERGALIGKQGSYVQRLETKYGVRVNFPRAEDDESVITIRGGKKGAESAKKELVELMEYEKENNQSTTVKVPAAAIPRIVGKQGSNISAIRDETGAEVDVNREEGAANGTITLKGTKQAIAAAKKAVQAIVNDVQDETTLEIQVPRSLHTNIIGRAGQNIRDLIAKCGGPSDPRTSGNLVRFPRSGDADGETVTIRGPSSLANKIKDEIEKQVAEFKDRVVYGVVVPQASHARLIGRGGAGINELQRKHNVRVAMPSGRFDQAASGALVNQDELSEHAETDLIRIVGSQKDCEAAAAEITQKSANATPPRQPKQQATPADQITKTVMVPASLHSRVTQGGKFFRNLPNGVKIDHGDVKPPSGSAGASSSAAKANGAAKAARIDEDGEDSEFDWQVTPVSGEQDDSAEDIPWNIRGNDQAKVDRVEGSVTAALERAKAETHKGVLTVPQALIPRIIGRQGAGLDKLRALGVSAEVEGRQNANTVVFMGSPENLEKAREAVMELNATRRERY